MGKNAPTKKNHYVARWYQRRFLTSDSSKFYYLDLTPEVHSHEGRRWTRRALRRLGPDSCFYQDDLYTLKLGGLTTDQIERRFFGPIDEKGKSAVELFSEYDLSDRVHDAFQDVISFMDAQRFRTPRALEWLARASNSSDRNRILMVMRSAFQYHTTMWTEAVWEVVSAKSSGTKFLLTDSPVTFYNSKAFSNGRLCMYPNDVDLGLKGTRTIFPLGLDHCLILTHVDYVRDPWVNPLLPRTNARAYQQTMMSLLDVQIGRELTEEEIIRINFILKQRATKFIAAVSEEWLYPEEKLRTTHWSKLDEDWFLLPNLYHVPFGGGLVVGYKGGASFAMDEYGRRPSHPKYQDKEQHQREWRAHLDSRVMWAVKRNGKSVGTSWEHRGRNLFFDMMAEDAKRFRNDPEFRARVRGREKRKS